MESSIRKGLYSSHIGKPLFLSLNYFAHKFMEPTKNTTTDFNSDLLLGIVVRFLLLPRFRFRPPPANAQQLRLPGIAMDLTGGIYGSRSKGPCKEFSIR